MYNHLFRDELHDLLSDTDAACTAAAMFLDNALLDDNGERAFMARLDHLSSNQAGTAPRFFIDSIRAKSRDVAESRSCRTNASQ